MKFLATIFPYSCVVSYSFFPSAVDALKIFIGSSEYKKVGIAKLIMEVSTLHVLLSQGIDC